MRAPLKDEENIKDEADDVILYCGSRSGGIFGNGFKNKRRMTVDLNSQWNRRKQ